MKDKARALKDKASRLRKPVSVNMAFTWTGLRALGLDHRTLASFPEDFRQGMAARAELLCDTGDTAPERWDQWLGNRGVHGVLWVNLRRRMPLADLGISAKYWSLQ